jgi:hypothetical protein
MVSFHSYVKLPEGTIFRGITSIKSHLNSCEQKGAMFFFRIPISLITIDDDPNRIGFLKGCLENHPPVMIRNGRYRNGTPQI